MRAPEIPVNERQRQLAVERLEALDSLPESSFDNITALMSQLCGKPISLVTLLDKDRNFLKSHHGIDVSESPRAISFCGHAINSKKKLFIVENALADERFADNPLVTDLGVRFYAGAPLIDKDGNALGTLCVFDLKPGVLTELQCDSLVSLSKQVMFLFELRLQEMLTARSEHQHRIRNDELRQFATVVSHDLKSPVNNIAALLDDLEEANIDVLLPDSLQDLRLIKGSTQTLRCYIDGLLEHYTSDELLSKPSRPFELSKLMVDVDNLTVRENTVSINFPEEDRILHTHRAAMTQILVNLVGNAVKYTKHNHPKITISLDEHDGYYCFSVVDNGPGIDTGALDSIFDLFSTAGHTDREGIVGTGIGLATVRRLAEHLGGRVVVQSEVGVGSSFCVEMPILHGNKSLSLDLSEAA